MNERLSIYDLDKKEFEEKQINGIDERDFETFLLQYQQKITQLDKEIAKAEQNKIQQTDIKR